MRAIDVGVMLPRVVRADPDVLAETARAIEEIGLHSLWVSEHIVMPVEIRSRYPFTSDGKPPFRYDTGITEAMVTIGFLAAVTTRIRLGTAVIPLFSLTPLTIAKLAATADHLAHGRLELGLGAGWLVEEAEALGIGSDQRGARLEEAIQIMRKAWSQPSVAHQGRFWRFPAVGVHPQPPQREALPIWIGGSGSEALRITARHAVGNIVWRAAPTEVAVIVRKLRALRRDLRVAVDLRLDGEVGALLARARAYVAAGADLFMLMDTSGDPRRFIREVRTFATEVAPCL